MLRNYWKCKTYKPSDAADYIRRRNGFSVNAPDAAVRAECIAFTMKQPGFLTAGTEECRLFINRMFSCLRCDLEILQELAEDPEVSEIMVNGCSGVFTERKGHLVKEDFMMDSPEQLRHIIQRLAAKVGRELNDLNPILDARLEDGSRVNAVNSNIALGGPVLTIRKFAKIALTMEDLISQEDITEEAALFLGELVRCGYNIFISGGTSSGKTTFLNILSECIPAEERIVVIEDSSELQIRGHENLVRMESKSVNIQGKGGVSIRELIRCSLRMRPDRIIVGEVRGEEVVDMLAAMSTGHDGSLSTGHANSPEGALNRLETMHLASSVFPLSAVRSQIADAIEIIVQLKRFPDGHRRLTEIAEITGIKNDQIEINTLFKMDASGRLEKFGELKNRNKLDCSSVCAGHSAGQSFCG